jgi:hypothetical protein
MVQQGAFNPAIMVLAEETADSRSYHMGNMHVAAGGSVGQGDHNLIGNNVVTELSVLPNGETLSQQFAALLEQISKDGSLDDDTRELAREKTEAVAAGLSKVKESPGMLLKALSDAKSWFSSSATWVGKELGEILKSDAAQKTLGTVTETGAKAALNSS